MKNNERNAGRKAYPKEKLRSEIYQIRMTIDEKKLIKEELKKQGKKPREIILESLGLI